MNDMATASFIGRKTAGVGVPEILSKDDALVILNVEDGAEANDIVVSDTIYGAGWDDITSIAPSKNTVYDKFETLKSASTRDAEDTMTDGSNLPDGAAIKAYGDANWGGGGIAGSDKQIQFNDGGSFGADAGLTFDKSNGQVGIGATSLKEQAAANADTAGYGQIWVKNTAPNQLWFTNDAGTDKQLDVGATGMPSGAIVLWSGSASNIPSGWKLCDGANSTPNLKDRFVVGAGNSYAVGATGGSTTMAHTHPIPENSYAKATGGDDNSIAYVLSSNYHITDIDTNAASNTENRPPYYALCYIMKT
jgi:hypothetical protein